MTDDTADDRLAALESEINACHRVCERLRHRATQLRERVGKLQQDNANLMSMCVANYQLHGSVDRQRVISAIEEIIVDLIGSEELIIFRVEDDRSALTPLYSFGVNAEEFAQVRWGEGIIGRTAKNAEIYLRGPNAESGVEPERTLTACVPLRVLGAVTGVIAVFSLLEQKHDTLTDTDRELLGFLAAHAGNALYCSQLHENAVLARGDT